MISSALGALLLGCGPDVDSWRARYGYEPDEVHRIRVGNGHRFPVVPVVVDGDTLQVVFDTGNMVGVSLSRGELERLGLPRVGEWTMRASDGSVAGRYGVHRARGVSVLGFELASSRIYELGHAELPGLVGPRFLRGKRWTLDYGRRLMAVSDRPAPPAQDSADGLPLVRASRHPDLLLVYGRVQGRRVLMELDTGKSRSTVDPRLAGTLGLSGNERGVEIPALQLGTHEFRVPSAKRVSLRGIDATVEDPIQVGIGSDLLRRVVVTVDFASRRVWLSERR